jgi:phytanoyl-CoA hydroxylase
LNFVVFAFSFESMLAIRVAISRTCARITVVARRSKSDSVTGVLSAAQLADFNKNGFLAIPSFSSPETLAELRNEAERIVRAADVNEASIFTTVNQVSWSDVSVKPIRIGFFLIHVVQTAHSDGYFLTSGDKVRCFFEENHKDVPDKLLAINKIGHGICGCHHLRIALLTKGW